MATSLPPRLSRIYKLPLAPGAVLSLPIALLVAWYAWVAWVDVDRYRRAAKDAPPLDAEVFHIALHDQFARDWRRLTLPARPADSTLRTMELSLTRENLDILYDTRKKKDGAAGYAEALLRERKTTYPIRVRYRGGQHWHWIGPQQSMKVRLDGDLLDGTRVFNLLNDVTPFGLEEELVLDFAREAGLLAPEYFPVWVRVNNTDMGVYRYEAQPEEGLLRRNKRMPGSMYSGDSDLLAPSGDAGGLFWDDKDGWSKVAWEEGYKEDRAALDRLLHSVTADTQQEFAEYAATSIDVERYAAFDALDVVFGGNDHDWFSNHKLYVDPYRGKIEPVAWAFRAFQHESRLNLVENPLLLRLKMTPGYLAARNRAVYELIVGKASVPEVRARADRLFDALAPDLEADPYWDAYKLLPRVTRYHRFMVRPMSKGRWLLSAQDEMSTFGRRNRWLLDRLERPGIAVDSSLQGTLGVIRVALDGDAAYRVRSATVVAPCSGSFDLFADDDLDGKLDRSRETLVARGPLGGAAHASRRVDLESGIRFARRENSEPKEGPVVAEVVPRFYRYFVSAPCAPKSIELEVDNVTTGGTRRLLSDLGSAPADPVSSTPVGHAGEVPRFAIGEISVHPWELPASPPPREVVLGPGRVEIRETRIFAQTDGVRIEPGTVLALGEGVSLIFRGRVTADGARITGLYPGKPHGGLVIEGPGSAGSRLNHVTVEGGTLPRSERIRYTAVVTVQDTNDVSLEHLRISGATGVDDALHIAYVRGLELQDVHVTDAPVDAIDLEFVEGVARGLVVARAGDDCLDLMGTTLRLDDSVFSGCTNNGISAGEETAVVAHGVLVADGKTGVLAKNGSSVQLSRSLVYRAGTALETKKRDVHYSGKSSIGAQDLSIVGCRSLVDAADSTNVDPGFVKTTLEGPGLEYLREEVLHLESWEELPRALDKIGGPS